MPDSPYFIVNLSDSIPDFNSIRRAELEYNHRLVNPGIDKKVE
ncbi:MAG: hypothetical protein WCH01_07030 [Methylococcaceae bacterium]|jgi:hypothetical protein